MTIHDIYTILVACDRAKAKAVRQKREAEEKLEMLEALRSSLSIKLRETQP